MLGATLVCQGGSLLRGRRATQAISVDLNSLQEGQGRRGNAAINQERQYRCTCRDFCSAQTGLLFEEAALRGHLLRASILLV